jgi:hypothetical protein
MPQASAPARDSAKDQKVAASADTVAAAPTVKAAGERFVSVVFTHRDATTASRAFVDLQQQYPKLLGRRHGEPQPVDVGDKGIWHRLIVLPPGSRHQATNLCDQLLTAGYERCWVKAYRGED